MQEIILLTDYQNRFGSKHNDSPYRSGMDKRLLKKYFNDAGYSVSFMQFRDIDFSIDFKDKLILYTSSEDIGYHYKSYIEDIVLGLEMAGAKVIPPYKFLRANNNKVFMEILREELSLNEPNAISSFYFGTLEEAMNKANQFIYPLVVKGSAGAMSKNVRLARDRKELISVLKKLTRTKNYIAELKEYVRTKLHKGYEKESKFRNKFIIQNFIDGLNEDWKMLIFGEKYFIFKRKVRRSDFRASGSGQSKYLYGSSANYPPGIFQFGNNIKDKLQIPFVSLDIAYKDGKFYLLEFQAVYFGTVGIINSDCYYVKYGDNFLPVFKRLTVEKVFVESVIQFITSK